MRKVLRRYPQIFPERLQHEELFYNLYGIARTRCYGCQLPSMSLLPMVDNTNHTSIPDTHDGHVINMSLHV